MNKYDLSRRMCIDCLAAIRGAALGAAVFVTIAPSAWADTPDRYRCFPVDGSPSYTTPGTCKGDVLRREPLSRDEIAELFAIQTRGRAHTRCTAADGSYSTFVPNDQECPSTTDRRTVEYANQSYTQSAAFQQIVDAAASSVGATVVPPSNQSATNGISPSATAVSTGSTPPQQVPLAQTPTAPTPSMGPTAGSSVPRSERSFTPFNLGILALAIAILWCWNRWRNHKPTSSNAKPNANKAHTSTPNNPSSNRANKKEPARQAQPVNMDENQRCTHMLEAFFNDATISGGLLFRNQLKQTQLDYSMDSLKRLDQLLRFLQPEIKPPLDKFINELPSQNFMRLVAYYIGMTVARLGQIPVKWLDYAQAKESLTDLELQFETSSICLLGERVYFPLGLVTEILLHPNAERNVPDWANQALQVAPAPMPSIMRNSAQATPTQSMGTQLQEALQQIGFVAAWSMFMVEGGATGAPMVYVPSAGGGGTFVDFGMAAMMGGDAQSLYKAAFDRMDTNPDCAAYQIMSFDGYANLHTGRTDAITVELRIYSGAAADQKVVFQAKVVCPYRNANDPKGFAIYSPKLAECSANASHHSLLFKPFYDGVASYKSNTFDWFKYLDESI